MSLNMLVALAGAKPEPVKRDPRAQQTREEYDTERRMTATERLRQRVLKMEQGRDYSAVEFAELHELTVDAARSNLLMAYDHKFVTRRREMLPGNKGVRYLYRRRK